jgi:hypothetical protein
MTFTSYYDLNWGEELDTKKLTIGAKMRSKEP